MERPLIYALLQGQEDAPCVRNLTRNNRLIPHNFQHVVSRRERCALENCGRIFEIELIPGQVLYPKYCERHRSEFQRELHRRRHASTKNIH
ncbi:MAG TPA: hypothetical protein VLM37_02750 [Fibrobacteraceae bacterium]|nr:hypothetical protein [Fibrobacteraceae bacterium]